MSSRLSLARGNVSGIVHGVLTLHRGRLKTTKTPTVCPVRVVGDSGHFYFRLVSSSERKKSLAVVAVVVVV